jgi:hypothetical protein
VAGAVTAGILVLSGLVILVGLTFNQYASADHRGILDDPDVTDVAEPAFERMTDTVRAAQPPAGATPEVVAAGISAQNKAIAQMIARIRTVDEETLRGDHPAVGWLEDWETVVRLRDDYAAALLQGGIRPCTSPSPEAFRSPSEWARSALATTMTGVCSTSSPIPGRELTTRR